MVNYTLRRIGNNWVLDESLNHNLVGGNKYRKLQYIIRDEASIAGILTFGSRYSSHLLASAFWARKLNVPMVGIVITDDRLDVSRYPHLNLAQKFGAQLQFTSNSEAFTFIEQMKQQYCQYLWIPGGAHTSSAADAYTDLFRTLLEENPDLKQLDAIILPFGTGTTALGIVRAIRASQPNTTVVGVSVARSRERCLGSLREFDPDIDAANLRIEDYFAGKYDVRSDETEEARWRFFRDSGIMLDPIYNAKAACIYYRERMSNTLLVNTGGMLNNLL